MEKSPDEKAEIIANSRLQAKRLYESSRKINAEIDEKKKSKLSEKKCNLAKLREKHFKERENLASKICFYGLWQNVTDVHTQLATFSTKCDKITALKVQLNFRKNVLEQPASDKLL